jgi:hypothetical protein
MRSLIKTSVLLAAFVGTGALAGDFQVGGQAGAVGSTRNSDLALGAYFMANPFGSAALRADIIGSSDYMNFGPTVYIFPINFSEFNVGLGGGASFHRFGPSGSAETKFGLSLGALGEFALSDQLKMGLELRQHFILDDAYPNPWSALLSLGFAFGTGGW